MAASTQAKVAEWKRDLVEELVNKFDKYPVVGILNITGIPAPQFQEMRDLLRDKAEIKVSRRVLLRVAMERAAEKNTGLKDFTDHLKGPCALIFTKMNPFQLWKILDENKTNAPAKPGMESPKDIIIPAGETDFPPGPIIGELQRAGIKARIQAGKIVILEDSKIVEEGEPIPEEVVGVLAKFGIEPREIGFELLAAYEDGTVFPGGMLVVDEEGTKLQIQTAAVNSLSLSLEIGHPTSSNVGLLVGRASSEARALALNASILSPDLIPEFLSKIVGRMDSLTAVILSKNPDAVDEELKTRITSSKPVKAEKVKEKAKEKPEEKEEKEEAEEKEEEEIGLGGLFE